MLLQNGLAFLPALSRGAVAQLITMELRPPYTLYPLENLEKLALSPSGHHIVQLLNCEGDTLLQKEVLLSDYQLNTDSIIALNIFLGKEQFITVGREPWNIHEFDSVMLKTYAIKGSFLWERPIAPLARSRVSDRFEAFNPLFFEEKILFALDAGIWRFKKQVLDAAEMRKFPWNIKSNLRTPLQFELVDKKTGKLDRIIDMAQVFDSTHEWKNTEILSMFHVADQHFAIAFGEAFRPDPNKTPMHYAHYKDAFVAVFDLDGKLIQRLPFPAGEHRYFKVKTTTNGFEVHTFEDDYFYSWKN